MSTRSSDDDLTEKEIDARREAGLKKLLATPPKPHAPKKASKPKRKAEGKGDKPKRVP
jgi:hypothetical protein